MADFLNTDNLLAGISNLGTLPELKIPNEPWAGEDRFKDVFFGPQNIDADRWNRLYPYRLLVIDVNRRNRVFGTGSDSAATPSSSTTSVKGEKGLEYIVTQQILTGQWIANLPISPQQLQITDQFAINTSATMRGIVEEHNGVKFKNIIVNGTTGIWPRKPTKEGQIKPVSTARSIFGGTLDALGDLAASGRNLGSMFSGDHPNRAKDAETPEQTDAGIFSTGYYQALYLAQFLERYAQLKKNPSFKSLRLVFDMPKQNQSFVVSPVSFSLNQNQQRPNEMLFNMQFKAWKRIELGLDADPAKGELPTVDANLFQQIISTINATRSLMSKAVSLVKAVRSDFQKPFNAMRQTILIAKDIIGIGQAISDLPGQIIKDFQNQVIDTINSTGAALSGRKGFRPSSNSSASTSIISTIGVKPTKEDVIESIIDKNKKNEGLPSEDVANGALGNDAADSEKTDPLNQVFENPEENHDFLNDINVDDLTLTQERLNAIETELERVRLLTVNDFREFRQDLLNLALEISDNFGAGDETYSSVYGLTEPRVRTLDLTVEENEIMNSLFETIQAYDSLIATKQFDDLNIESPLEYIGGLADEAGIDFENFTSKFLVPVPFGSTIEEIAAKYMADADKWIEIVTLNSLRSPYIDEEGFTLTFISNADGRQFNVDDADDNLFIGQKIIIQSDTIQPFTRKIIDVEKIADGNFLVSVDGAGDLDTLTTTDNARMLGHLPGTVNSQNQIYIPSNEPSAEDDRTFEIDGLGSPSLTKFSKIDFLLTENFDIAINTTGDFRLANGLTNLIQALKLKIRTKKGTILRHLDYGIGLTHGISVADIENGEIIKSLNKMIEEDDRFEQINKISIRLSGSTLSISMDISIPNQTGVVPITFDVKVS